MRVNKSLERREASSRILLTEHLAEIGVVEIRILVGQLLALDLCPDHERVHGATYPLLLEAPLGSAAAGMAHLYSRGDRRDALLVFQRWTGSQPGHVLQPLLRRAAQHARYLETMSRCTYFAKTYFPRTAFDAATRWWVF